MEALKIYEVTYFHGGWVSGGYPSVTVVATSDEEAKNKAIEIKTSWNRDQVYAKEFKLDGYVIEVYDEKTYNREKNLEKLI